MSNSKMISSQIYPHRKPLIKRDISNLILNDISCPFDYLTFVHQRNSKKLSLVQMCIFVNIAVHY